MRERKKKKKKKGRRKDRTILDGPSILIAFVTALLNLYMLCGRSDFSLGGVLFSDPIDTVYAHVDRVPSASMIAASNVHVCMAK